jgi:hypothetical protein
MKWFEVKAIAVHGFDMGVGFGSGHITSPNQMANAGPHSAARVGGKGQLGFISIKVGVGGKLALAVALHQFNGLAAKYLDVKVLLNCD